MSRCHKINNSSSNPNSELNEIYDHINNMNNNLTNQLNINFTSLNDRSKDLDNETLNIEHTDQILTRAISKNSLTGLSDNDRNDHNSITDFDITKFF